VAREPALRYPRVISHYELLSGAGEDLRFLTAPLFVHRPAVI